jgi:hypothetical protein
MRGDVLGTFPALMPNLLLAVSAAVETFFVAPRVQGVLCSGITDCTVLVAMIELVYELNDVYRDEIGCRVKNGIWFTKFGIDKKDVTI